MSFPYKIRKVAWGSCKPPPPDSNNTASTTTNNFDPTLHLLGGDNNDDPHTIGGNLQRAILLDLIELRHRYYIAVSQVATTANNNTNHITTGISFAQFKKCFREARFGAIHTRTIPARVDRGEYVQLLYSSCFYLLEQAFDSTHTNQSQEVEVGNDTNCTLNWNDNGQRHSSAFNAIYAVFILYTLHKTNILPKPPPTTNISSSSNNEQSLQNSWSMLPLGNNNDEDKLYRRTFHGNIRIDRYNYILLLRLREICIVRMEQCDISSKKMEFSSTTAESDTNASSWQCNCSLARDTVYILDIMLSNNNDDFFEYCEYHGPHSLEGLSGSSNFYRAYFSNQKSTESSSNVVSTTATHAAVCNEPETNEMINNNDDTLDIQSLSQLVKTHQSNLATVMSQLYKSRHTKDDELQPKQRELVENTLKEINIPNEELPLQLLANDKNTANDKAKSPESPTLLESKQESTTKHVSFLQFPETFSTTLCNEIRSSLVDFRTDIDMIRKAVIKKKRKDEVRMNQQVVIDYGDDFASIGESEPVKRQPSDIANESEDEASRLGRKRQRSGVDDEFDLEEDVLERDDDLSVATGGGRNALYSLLSMVGGNGGSGGGSDGSNYGEDDSIATAEADHIEDKIVPQSNGKSHIQPMASIDDDASVVSGMGTRALHFLLSHQSTKKQSKRHPKKKRAKSSRKAQPKDDKNEDEERSLGEDASDSDEEDISVAAGTNALASLLAHV